MSSAFHFFNDVDEWAHFDLVYKYSRGYLPHKGNDLHDPESSRIIITYASPEYLRSPESFRRNKIPPPLWTAGQDKVNARVERMLPGWTKTSNHEAFSPPVYYAIAGMWYKIGEFIGLEKGNLLYWLRFLNVLAYFSLVWCAYFFIRKFYPGNTFIIIAVPIMLAVFPQDVFYSINSDVLSPLFFTLSLYYLLSLCLSESVSLKYYFIAGIVTALTFLIKYSNVAIIGIFIFVLFHLMRKFYNSENQKKDAYKLLLLISSVALPIILWHLRNYIVLDDIMGTSGKIELLGWRVKPFGEILHHPIFSPKGFVYFWDELTKTYCCGELTWHAKELSSKSFDLFYTASSFVFISISLISSLKKWGNKRDTKAYRFVNGSNFFVLFLSIAFLIFLSMYFDFGDSHYPSRDYPYMCSGRLISGSLIPFLILYIDGIHVILKRCSNLLYPFIVVLIIISLITYSEISLNAPVFESQYNWFHLP